MLISGLHSSEVVKQKRVQLATESRRREGEGKKDLCLAFAQESETERDEEKFDV